MRSLKRFLIAWHPEGCIKESVAFRDALNNKNKTHTTDKTKAKDGEYQKRFRLKITISQEPFLFIVDGINMLWIRCWDSTFRSTGIRAPFNHFVDHKKELKANQGESGQGKIMFKQLLPKVYFTGTPSVPSDWSTRMSCRPRYREWCSPAWIRGNTAKTKRDCFL